MTKKEIADRLLNNPENDITKQMEKQFLTNAILKGLKDQGIDTSHITIETPLTAGQKTILAAKWLLTGRIEGEEGKINFNGLEKIPMDNHKESDFSEEEVTKIVKQLLNERTTGSFSVKGMAWGPECYIVAEKKELMSEVYPVKNLDPFERRPGQYLLGSEPMNLRIFETIPEAKVCIAKISNEDEAYAEKLEIYECQLIVRNIAEKGEQ